MVKAWVTGVIAWNKLLIKSNYAWRKAYRGGVNKVIKFVIDYIKD